MSSCGVGFVCNVNGTKSHDLVKWGIEAVKNLTHRGAVGADGKTGDDAGILFQIPKKFFLKEKTRFENALPNEDNLAVGFFFLYQNLELEIETILKKYGFNTMPLESLPSRQSRG